MTNHPTIAITLTVTTDNVAAGLRASEHLHRAAFGYALDGLTAEMEIVRLKHVDIDDTEDADAEVDEA